MTWWREVTWPFKCLRVVVAVMPKWQDVCLVVSIPARARHGIRTCRSPGRDDNALGILPSCTGHSVYSGNTWLCVHWQWNTLEWCPLNALQASPVVHLVTPLSCVSLSMNTQPSVPAFITHANLKCKKYIHLCDEICVWFHLKVGN